MTGLHLAPRPLFLPFRILFPDLCAQGHGRHSSQFVEICIGCTCTSPSFFLLVIGTLALKYISFNIFPRHCVFQWNGLCIWVYKYNIVSSSCACKFSQGSDQDLREIKNNCLKLHLGACCSIWPTVHILTMILMSAISPTFYFIHSINQFFYLDSSTRLHIPIYNLIFLLHSITPKLTIQFVKEVSAGSVSYWRDVTIGDSNKQIMPMCIIINIRPR